MLLIDTDPGLDDAFALAMAFAAVHHDEIALTTVAGNVGIDVVTRNALRLAQALAPTVPVHRGSPGPLVGPRLEAAHVHGEDGLGGFPWPEADATAHHPTDAVAAILAASRRHGADLTIVALGPLTNLALALRVDPGLADRLGRVVAMGGTPAGLGNASINAEFNFFADPVAAEIVCSTVPDLTLITWDLTLDHRYTREQIEAMAAGPSAGAALMRAIEQHRWTTDAAYASATTYGRCDPLAMAVALDPSVVTASERHPVVVGHSGGLDHGVSVVDHRDLRTERPLVRIPTALDRARAFELLTL